MINYLRELWYILLLDPDQRGSVIGFSLMIFCERECSCTLRLLEKLYLVRGTCGSYFQPMTSSFQASAQETMEIGQFLKIKYKVGRVMEMAVIDVMLSSLKFLDIIIPLAGKLMRNTTGKFLGNLCCKFSPLEFINVFGPINDTLFRSIRRLGTITNDNITQMSDNTGDRSRNCSDTNIDDTIPTQNIKFQKLSLVASLFNMILSLSIEFIRAIVSCHKLVSKGFLVRFAIFGCSIW